MLQLLTAQRAAASAAARQYHALQHAAAAVATPATTTTSSSGLPPFSSSSPSAPAGLFLSQSLRCVTTTGADHQAQAKPKEQPAGEAATQTTQQKHERATPATLGRPPRTFASRRERVTPAPPTAAVDFAPYQLKVYLSNRYTYASILRRTSPSDPGHFVASASTLGERPPRRAAADGAGADDGPPSASRPDRVSLSDSAASARVGRALAERAAAAGLLSPAVPVELSTRMRGRGGGVAPRSGADPRAGTGRNPRRRFVGRLRALVEAAREAGLVVH